MIMQTTKNIGIDARCLEWKRGGVANYLANLLKHLPDLAEGYRFFLYFENRIPSDDFLQRSIFTLRIVRGPRLIKKNTTLSYLFLMSREARKDNLSLFLSTWYCSPFFMGEIRTVVAAWDISYTTHPSHFPFRTRLVTSFLSRKSCKESSGVITCSDYDADQISKYYGVNRGNICVVYLAADDRFNEKLRCEQLAEFRQKYQLPDKFILSFGAIYNRRNVDVIIKSFEKIQNSHPGFGLVVVGKNATNPIIDIGMMMSPLIKQGRGAYIEWMDDLDLPYLYQAAYAYICTSTVDGETIQLKEAMKSGIPVITSPLLERTIGGNGFIIGDPTSITETSEMLARVMAINGEFEQIVNSGIKWNNTINWRTISEKSFFFIASRCGLVQ
jgi:glycosyltransferase involved in cell wall biosynthesis